MSRDRGLAKPAIGKARLEFLFDGIYAIAMTVLVLELKVPDLATPQSTVELWNALLRVGPTFFSYLLSFLILGRFWYHHNLYFKHFQFITKKMLNLHFFMLVTAGFLPFSSALLGRYGSNGLAWLIYSGTLWVYAISAYLLWSAARAGGALTPETTEAEYQAIRKVKRRRLIGVGIWFCCSAASMAWR